MKKIFSSLAIAAVALGAVPAMAQTQNTQAASAQAQVQYNNCAPNNCAPDYNCLQDENCAPGGSRRDGSCYMMGCFEGLDLSDAQKAQLKDLREKTYQKRVAGKQALKDQKEKVKSDYNAARDAAKREYLDGVKKILGEKKYVQFLENSYIRGNNGGKDFRPGRPGGKDKVKAYKGNHHGKPGKGYHHKERK